MKEESRIVEETRQKIATGELTYDQMKEKLIAAIDKEYEKEEEPNIELVNACEELLAELATDGQPLPESHQEKYGEVIRQNIQVSHHSRNRVGFVKRLAISLVVLVLLLGGGQVFLHREWFEHGTTVDEQQHTVQGFVVDPNLIAKCIAEEGNTTAVYYSDKYSEISDYLGFDLPQKVFLEDWEPVQFFVEIEATFVKCSILFSNPMTSEKITIQIGLFTDIENAYTTFEQNEKGHEITIGSKAAYYSRNMDNDSIIWLDGNCIWRLYGHLNDEATLKILEKVLGGNKYE